FMLQEQHGSCHQPAPVFPRGCDRAAEPLGAAGADRLSGAGARGAVDLPQKEISRGSPDRKIRAVDEPGTAEWGKPLSRRLGYRCLAIALLMTTTNAIVLAVTLAGGWPILPFPAH